MTRRTFLIVGGAVLLAGIALFIIGACVCENKEDDTPKSIDPFADNYGLEYIAWKYRGVQLEWRDEYNLTSTSEKFDSDIGCAESDFMISNWDEYQECLAVIEQKEADIAKSLENAKGKYPPSELRDYDATLYTVAVDTMEHPIDKTFFDNYSLAVIDFCYRGDPYVRSRLDDVAIENDVVTVTISRYHVVATTADQKGNVYWVPVPKECTELSVVYHTTLE